MQATPSHPAPQPTLPLWKGLIASVLVHTLAAILLGTLPRVTAQPAASESLFEELPAVVTLEPPEPPAPAEAASAKAPELPKPEPEKQLAEQPQQQTKSVSPPPPPPPVLAAKEPEPRQVRLGSNTSLSEAATMTWLGFDEYIEHTGAQSEVDQAQFTMDAPGPRASVPSEGANAPMGNPIVGSGATASPRVQPQPAPASAPDTPTLIADQSARPPSPKSTNAPEPARSPSNADSPPPPSQPAPSLPIKPGPEAEQAEPREKVTAAAPAPTSLPQSITKQDNKEIAQPNAGNPTGETTITPREGVSGSSTPPEFPIQDQAIKPADDPKTETGPAREAIRPAQPTQQSEEAAKPDSLRDTPEHRNAPRESEKENAKSPSTDEAQSSPLPAAPESQGPRPDPATETKPIQTPQSPNSQNPQQPPDSPANPAPPGPQGIPVQPRAGNGQEGRGILSDRESLAAAIKKAIVVDKWGQPLVAKGLRIRTVRPKFSKYTEITSRGSPVVRILFDRTGKAKEVILLSSSGVQDVDRPVVDAAYQWIAAGKELEELREIPPETVAIDVRVIR